MRRAWALSSGGGGTGIAAVAEVAEVAGGGGTDPDDARPADADTGAGADVGGDADAPARRAGADSGRGGDFCDCSGSTTANNATEGTAAASAGAGDDGADARWAARESSLHDADGSDDDDPDDDDDDDDPTRKLLAPADADSEDSLYGGDPVDSDGAESDAGVDHDAFADACVDADFDSDSDDPDDAPAEPEDSDAGAANDDARHLNYGKVMLEGAAMNEKLNAVHAGPTRVVGWTFERANKLSETSTSNKGLRPMHVRVSIRVHHVAFLHPGLDNGSRATMGDRSRYGEWSTYLPNLISERRLASKLLRRANWLESKLNSGAPPSGALLQFGSKRGRWTNPNARPRGNFASGEDKSAKEDTSEIFEIISAEAYRLSRDGIIQHHYALNHASLSPRSSITNHESVLRDRRPRRTRSVPHPSQSNFYHPALLSPHSSMNPQEAARYYRECADRPKGYRRLVVSSATQTSDLPLPPPLSTHPYSSHNKALSASAQHKSDKHGSDSQRRITPMATKDATTIGVADKDTKKDGKNNERLFDNVEYQYVSLPAITMSALCPYVAVIPENTLLCAFADRPTQNRSRLLSTPPPTRRGHVRSLPARAGVQRPRPLDFLRRIAQFQHDET